MIELIAPRAGSDKFVIVEDLLVGPLADIGVSDAYESISSWRSDLDFLTESPGIFHENHVDNQQVTGTLSFAPVYYAIVPDPLHDVNQDKPDQIKLFVTKTSSIGAGRGLAVNGTITHTRVASTYTHYVFDSSVATGNVFTVCEAVCGGSPAKLTSYYTVTYQMTAFTATSAYFTKTTTFYTVPSGYMPVDWKSFDDAVVSPEFVRGLQFTLARGSSSSMGSITTLRKPYYDSPPVLSPSNAREAADAVVRILLDKVFPIEDVHYGDLAMQASSTANANKVNMLEFLSDLRDPTSMIPKLRNLSSVKGIAGNVLSVDFGLLPTISDIRSIVAACRRISPYLDKGGREIHTSGSTQEKQVGDYTYRLTQRLKLAIGKEDSALDGLTSRLESMGVLPNLENIWDLLPYSFLVDWLVDVGGFLERIDSRLRLARFNIDYVTMSRKQEIEINLNWSSTFPYTGQLVSEWYHRWVSDQCPTPPLSLHTTFDGFDHWIDATALYLQRRK